MRLSMCLIKECTLIFPTNARKLVLDSNSITCLEKNRFIASRLTELEEISINDCEIETIKIRAFSGLTKLALLSMCGNKLRKIKQRTFKKMNLLAYLVFVDNIIEHLEFDIISRLISLKLFYLTIKKIAGCPSRLVLRIAQS